MKADDDHYRFLHTRWASVTLAAAALLMLSACQSINERAEEISIERKLPEAGSRFVLNSALPVEPYRSRTIIQNGEVKTKPDLYIPWCTLHVFRPREGFEQPAEIQSGEFIIDESYRREEYSSIEREWGNPNVRIVAGVDMWDTGSQHSSVTQSVYFELRSPDQPEIRRLVCSIFADPTEYKYPTLAQINTTLGSVATIDQL